jgi:hypothetical protein
VRVALLTREYPPDVYGGGGVHVEYLARELARREELTVHCWGEPRDAPGVIAHRAWDALVGPEPHLAALQAMSIDLVMAARAEGAELVHSHTWYANLAGHLAKLTYGVPHVATVHSLEPLRPWKAEQLGGGYALSSFCERVGLEGADALVAVSEGMRRDILASYPAVDGDRRRRVRRARAVRRAPGTRARSGARPRRCTGRADAGEHVSGVGAHEDHEGALGIVGGSLVEDLGQEEPCACGGRHRAAAVADRLEGHARRRRRPPNPRPLAHRSSPCSASRSRSRSSAQRGVSVPRTACG